MKEGNTIKSNTFRMVKTKLYNILAVKGRKNKKPTVEDLVKATKKEYKELKEEMDFLYKSLKPNSSKLKEISAKLSYLSVLLPEESDAIKQSEGNMGKAMKFLKDSGKNINFKQASEKIKEALK